MKRLVSVILVMILALTILALPAMAEEKIQKIGTLTLLNLSEADYVAIHRSRAEAAKLLNGEADEATDALFSEEVEIVYFDSLNELLMALDSGIIQAADLSKEVAAYIAARDDSLMILRDFSDMPNDGENGLLVDFVFDSMLSCDYSFMARAENEALLDEMEVVVEEMYEDGTMDALIEKFIDDAMNGDPEVETLESAEGRETLRVILTGDMPPIDFMTAGGEPTGFNVALLAEIGRRLDRNIELICANAGARALMLSSGEADVAFWTRSSGGIQVMMIEGIDQEDWAELFDIEDEADERWIDVINKELVAGFNAVQYGAMDIPEGLAISDPYYESFSVLLVKKSLVE